MSVKTPNSFNDGLNQDLSDMVIRNTMMRNAMNIRLINLSGTTFALSNIKGTEVKFQLNNGYIPVASKEFGEVLYILSWNPGTQRFQAGSYPSPDPSGGNNYYLYRPFNNVVGATAIGDTPNPFDTAAYGIATFPIIQELVIQPDYDRSVNLFFTIKGQKPRVINSKFYSDTVTGNLVLTPAPIRPGNANTNSYTPSSIEKETQTIVSSPIVLKIAFQGLSAGGKLKPGNYRYVFYYMTEDFVKTNVVGQSSVVQIAFGNNANNMKGGNETQVTNYRAVFNLSSLDTDFKFLKVYVMYSAGQEGLIEQYLEIIQPIEILGSSMVFTHSGYEDLLEVSSETVDIDYYPIDSADASTQVNGYYFLGALKQTNFNYTPFRAATANIVANFAEKPISPGTKPVYADPLNVYNYMGYWGGEAYPFGIVYIMKDGSSSPVFPLRGVDFLTNSQEPVPSGSSWYKGIMKFRRSNQNIFFHDGQAHAKYMQLNLSSIPAEVKDNSIGFFVVRGERKTALLSQGVIIPTLKVPTREDFSTDNDANNTYYQTYQANIDDTKFFKHYPVLDSLLESYSIDYRDSDNQFNVVDESNVLKDGYMPIFINDMTSAFDLFTHKLWFSKDSESHARHWAFLSGEAFANEAALISTLQRDNTGILQIAKVAFNVQGEITPVYSMPILGPGAVRTGLWYEFNAYTVYASTAIKTARRISFVPGESLATGSDFVSRVATTFYYDHDGASSPDIETFFYVKNNANAFFGIEMETGSSGELVESDIGVNKPIGGNNRVTPNLWVDRSNTTSGTVYDNFGKIVQGAFLINVYDSNIIPSIDDLYPTIDSVVYRQIGDRFLWTDLPTSGPMSGKIDVFGGDCFISKVYRKLNQSGLRDPTILQSNPDLRYNIDQGMMLSWWQESTYNLNLREPKFYDTSEIEERSFFPYQSRGDYNLYRRYRYPETSEMSPGYSRVLTPKNFYGVSVLAPNIQNEFFSRVARSEKHIPNAFKNGFRIFAESRFRDYDSAMGRITGMFNHRGRLLIIFEHGIGITEVDQRIQTGGDAAGSIYVKPEDVLPPNLSYFTREIGCQDTLSFIQTPAAVYGVDRSRDIIWQIKDGLTIISDSGFSSFLKLNPITNPRSGYDPEFHEVLFTTDNWTLCFREGIERFTSFYSFKPNFYSRRGKEFYSFLQNVAHKQNAPVYTIYGENKRCFVEFVINENFNMAKVCDYLNIISNEVTPESVTIYTQNQSVSKTETINPAGSNQYLQILDGTDPFTGEPLIVYRDKKFVVQIPKVEEYNPGSANDNWGIDSRMRNKYFIVRLTYNTELPLELASVITTFRYSAS